MKKISIITVVYNAKDLIEKTVLSVGSQCYSDIEYIIIDGGSSDGTLDVLNKYAGSIALLISEPDAGIYNAMNKGIRMASGDVVHLLNAGDYYAHDSVVERVMSVFNGRGLDCVSIPVQYVMQDGDRRDLRMIGDVDTIPHPGFFCSSALYKKFPFDETIKFASDIDFFLRAVKSEHVFTLDSESVVMPAGGAGSSFECLGESFWIYIRYGKYSRALIVALKIAKRILLRRT